MADLKIHNKFLEYLQQTLRKSEERSLALVEFAETKLPEFIRRYFDADFGELYDNTDHRYYDDVRGEMFNHPAAAEEDAKHDDAYTEALAFYSKFLDSKTFNGREKVQLTAHEKALKKEKAQKKSQQPSAQPQPPTPKADPLQPSVDSTEELTEGRIRQVNITRHERNRELRQRCLQRYGYVCQVCGMNFEERYGDIGKDFIEVHHLNPIAQTDGEHALDPEIGLVPLCSNCHSMIHRGGKDGLPMKLDDLKALYNQHKKESL